MGFSRSSEPAKPLLTRYFGGEATRRYDQNAAIRAVLEKLARGDKRALLTLATGAGKTFARAVGPAGQSGCKTRGSACVLAGRGFPPL